MHSADETQNLLMLNLVVSLGFKGFKKDFPQKTETHQILYAIFFAVSTQEYSVLLMLEGGPT